VSGCPTASYDQRAWRITATSGIRVAVAFIPGVQEHSELVYQDMADDIAKAIAARAAAVQHCLTEWSARWLVELQPLDAALEAPGAIETLDFERKLWSFTIALRPAVALTQASRVSLVRELDHHFIGFTGADPQYERLLQEAEVRRRQPPMPVADVHPYRWLRTVLMACALAAVFGAIGWYAMRA